MSFCAFQQGKNWTFKLRYWAYTACCITWNALVSYEVYIIRSQVVTSIQANRLNHYLHSYSLQIVCGDNFISRSSEISTTEWKKDTRDDVSFNVCRSGFSILWSLDISKCVFCLMFKCRLLPDTYRQNIIIWGSCVAGSVEKLRNLWMTWRIKE